jgi:hypothetical protein
MDTNLTVQHILKAYSQQISARSRQVKGRVDKKIVQRDEVTISETSKKMLTVDKITNEIIAQLVDGTERNDTSRRILKQLSKEYGRSLDVSANDSKGLSFKVLNEKEDRILEYLPATENEKLEKRLFDITRSMIYDDLK